MALAITPRGFHPPITIDSNGNLEAPRASLASGDDVFAGALEFAAIAVDDVGRPLFGKVPDDWLARLLGRIDAARRRRRALESPAATVLLNLAEGSRALRERALAAYFEILARTDSVRLRESMVANLERARRILDDAGRARLAAEWERVIPIRPPYHAWFPHGDAGATMRILCQVQDVFYGPWRGFMRSLGFRPQRGRPGRDGLIHYELTIGKTRFEMEYRRKKEGIFTAMQDPSIHCVMFLGHSDWWARVPRNLRNAPDQVGEKLLVLILCFGKHFYHSLHERYPSAHILTSKDPTEDPEDVALLRHLLGGIAARKTWSRIRRDSDADARTDRNFIFPGDARYVAGVNDEDRDGRIDRFDRYCNLSTPAVLAPETIEDSFVPDPLDLHPRGVELNPRELDGGRVFEAALLLNSLSYDNYFLDRLNMKQRVLASGWHLPRPGELAAGRFSDGKRDGASVVRVSASLRYARATEAALAALLVYEGYLWFAEKLRPRQQPLDRALMGAMLVGHALGNAGYRGGEAVWHAFLRRTGFPHMPHHMVMECVEADRRWESGSPRAIAALKKCLPAATVARLERLFG